VTGHVAPSRLVHRRSTLAVREARDARRQATMTLVRVTSAVTTPPHDPYRLPRTVTPSRYELELKPDLAAASFRGDVHIVVAAAEDVAGRILNAAELTIGACRIDGNDAVARLDEPSQRLFITPADVVVPAGDHVIDVEFDGILN